MSTDIQRLRDELALAEASEVLEKARDAFHENRTPARVKRFKAESRRVQELRQAFREKYPTQAVSDGDAVAQLDTVQTTSEVKIR